MSERKVDGITSEIKDSTAIKASIVIKVSIAIKDGIIKVASTKEALIKEASIKVVLIKVVGIWVVWEVLISLNLQFLSIRPMSQKQLLLARSLWASQRKFFKS